MLENVWEFLQCVKKKTGTKRRNENKFHKFIWFRGEEKNKLIFKVLQSKTEENGIK